jgi:hypothetical protein
MSEGVLTVLKLCLLALLYLFVARVVWVVAWELRGSPAVARDGEVTAATRSRSSRGRGWRLVVVEPRSEAGMAYPVDGELTIGRGGGCGIPLPHDTFVSNVHARVFERDHRLWIEDLGSTNGTVVNGGQIDGGTRLRKGDRVGIGHTVLEAAR